MALQKAHFPMWNIVSPQIPAENYLLASEGQGVTPVRHKIATPRRYSDEV
jgi:hypothetical protein